VNRRGDAVLAWQARDGIRVAFARNGGDFGRGRHVRGSELYSSQLAVALGEGGRAAIASQECRPGTEGGEFGGCTAGVRAATRRPGRRFGRARWVSAPEVSSTSPRAAIADGHAAIVWDQDEGESIGFARTGPRMRFGRPRTLFDGGSSPFVGFTRIGTESFMFSLDGMIWSATRARRGQVPPARPVIHRQAGLRFADWAADGEFAVVWTEGPEQVVWAATGFPARKARAREIGAGVGPTAIFDLDVAPRGAAVVAWIERHDGPLWASVRAPGEAFTDARAVELEPGRPAVAASDAGTALLAWTTGDFSDVRTASSESGDFSPGRSFPLAPRSRNCTGGDCRPSVGLDARARGYMAWNDGADVLVARYRP
jgi:hypothetical protein